MLRIAIIPVALLAMLAGAMVWSSSGNGPPADFTFTNRGDNKTLDLGVMSWMQDMRDAYALWEGLYTPDPVTLKPIPGVSGPADISDHGLVYTFHIRPEARWSNGAPVTSGDFVFGWRRMLEQPGEYTYLFEYIKGGREYEDAYDHWKQSVAAGRHDPPPDFGTVGIKAPDSRTLIVTLAHPVPYFFSLCAFPSLFPQYEPCMRAFAKMDPTGTYVASYDQAFTRPPNLVSNGPYRLESWTFKRRFRIVANEYYRDRAHVHCRIIDQVNIDDPMAALRAFLDRKIDWMSEVDDEMARDLITKKDPDLKRIPAFGTYFYDFNCEPKLPDGTPNPFADRRVRRAFVMAIDKRPIVRNVTGTGEPIATTLIPRNSFADYPSPPGLPYDVPEAKRLMAEAGYPDGAGFPRLRIMFNNEFTEHAGIAQVVRRQWQQNLGVVLELEGVEIKVFAARLHNHDFNVARASWYGDYYDPSTFTDVFKSSSDNNDPDWRFPPYDALLHEAENQLDPHERFRTLAKAENMLLEEAPIIPLYQYVGHYLVQPDVHGIPLDPREMVMMQSIRVDR